MFANSDSWTSYMCVETWFRGDNEKFFVKNLLVVLLEKRNYFVRNCIHYLLVSASGFFS